MSRPRPTRALLALIAALGLQLAIFAFMGTIASPGRIYHYFAPMPSGGCGVDACFSFGRTVGLGLAWLVCVIFALTDLVALALILSRRPAGLVTADVCQRVQLCVLAFVLITHERIVVPFFLILPVTILVLVHRNRYRGPVNRAPSPSQVS